MDEKSAYVLLEGRAGQIFAILDELSTKNISAHAVTGPYDIIALIKASDTDTLARLVMDEIQSIEGVSKTLTCFVIGPISR